MMVEKRQSSSRAVQGYTTGCSPAPEPPASLGKALSSWKDRTGSEQQEARGHEDPLWGPGTRWGAAPPQSSLPPWGRSSALGKTGQGVSNRKPGAARTPCGVRAGLPRRFSPPKPSQPWAPTLALCCPGSKDGSTTTFTLRKLV